MELAKHIKAHRGRLGMSQEELAEKIFVSRQTISNWETDRTYPDVQSLLLLSNLFDVSIDSLIKGDVEEMKAVFGYCSYGFRSCGDNYSGNFVMDSCNDLWCEGRTNQTR